MSVNSPLYNKNERKRAALRRSICDFIRRTELIMTGKTRSIYSFYLFGAITVTTLVTVLRTIAILRFYEPENGYFSLSSAIPSIANWITVGAVLLLLTAVFTLRRKLQVTSVTPHIPTLFSSAFAGFMLLAFGTFHVASIFRELTSAAPMLQSVIASTLAVVLSFVGVASFVATALRSSEVDPLRASAFSAVVLFCLFYVMYLYFEKRYALNADIKILSQMALLSSAIYFLYEARIALGRPRWAARTAVGMIAMLLTASVSIPNLIFAVARKTPALETPVQDFLLFAFFLYILARLTSLKNRDAEPIGGFFGEALAAMDENEAPNTLAAEPLEQLSFFAPSGEGPSEASPELAPQDPGAEQGSKSDKATDGAADAEEEAQEPLSIFDVPEQTDDPALDGDPVTDEEVFGAPEEISEL
jgi:hypothetical protein